MEEQEITEPVPKGKNKPIKLLPYKEPLKFRELQNESRKKKSSKSSGIGPMCIFIKEHGQRICQRLEKLHKRQQNGLLDLTIVCQDKKLQAHKVVMAASSKFFCAQLCRSNILVPVILKLEDFGLDLHFEAVKHLIEFVYCGKVTIPGELLKHVCMASHALGVHGLVEFLPASSLHSNSSLNNDDISLSSDDDDNEDVDVDDAEADDQELEDESPEQSPSKFRSAGSYNGGDQRVSTRESVSTEIGDVITGSSNGGSDENTNSNQQFETEETSSRENMDAASNSVAQQNSQNVQLNFAATSSMQYPLESASYIFQSSNNNSHNVGQQHQHQHQQQQQQLQQLHLHQQHFSSPVHLHMDDESNLSVAPTPFESDEVEILNTSIGSNPLSGHSLYVNNQTMSFKPYPEHKTPSDMQSLQPVGTFTSSHCSQHLVSSTVNYAPNPQYQSTSSFQPSKGKLRIINQEGIITNTAENIQTPSNETRPPPPLNYKMTPYKIMPTEQIFALSDNNVLEEQQLFYHTIQGGSNGGSCITLPDAEAAAGFGQQLSSAQPSAFLPSVLPHSFVAWNSMSSSLNDDISNGRQATTCSKEKSGATSQMDLPEMDNAWLVGGNGGTRTQNFHCNETIAMIAEGSWTTPAEPSWIPEEITSREDGDSRTSSVSIDCGLHQDQPPPSTPNWHSSVVVSDVNIEGGNHVTKLTFEQQILELEEVNETSRDDLETATNEMATLPPPPALIDSRPTDEASKKRKKSSSAEGESCGSKEKKKRDLEVRKDLTLPTAPTAGVDNVFQPDDSHDPGSEDPISESSTSGLISIQDQEILVQAKDHPCRECSMTFPTNTQLKSHLRHAHHVQEKFSCSVCKESGFKEKESLKMHLYKTHGMGEFFRCEECNFETSIKASYIRHLSAHAETQMNCTRCNKTFKSKAGLKLHLKQHFEENLFKCDFCDFKTPQKANYLKHLATKHKKSSSGEELKMNKSCSFCTFQCVADYQLKSHILRKHTNKKDMKFQCESCDYASVEKAALDKHVRFKHTNERPYLCQICGFSTHTMSAMSRHKRGHSKSKPHVCETCGLAYADRKRLNDHMLGHEGKLPFACDFCGFSSRRKDNLQSHIRRVHPDLLRTSQDQSGTGLTESEIEGEEVSTTVSTTRESEEIEAKFFFSESIEDRATPLGDSDLKIVAIDRSHIVGHVNSDGSIRPVVNVQDAATSNVVVLTSTAAPDLTSVSRLEHDYVRDEKTELFETTSNDLFKENTT